jgi:hypothetical protein
VPATATCVAGAAIITGTTRVVAAAELIFVPPKMIFVPAKILYRSPMMISKAPKMIFVPGRIIFVPTKIIFVSAGVGYRSAFPIVRPVWHAGNAVDSGVRLWHDHRWLGNGDRADMAAIFLPPQHDHPPRASGDRGTRVLRP